MGGRYGGRAEKAGEQPCCPASALTCSPVHRPRLPPLSAPRSSHSHPFVACPSASSVPMFPDSPPSSLLLPPPPALMSPRRPVLSHPTWRRLVCCCSLRQKKVI